ncbi:hypothetical protein ACLMJK_008506 [Lecanora helva]
MESKRSKKSGLQSTANTVQGNYRHSISAQLFVLQGLNYMQEQDEPPLAGSYASEQSSTSTAATYGSSLLSNVSEQSSISTDTSEPPRLSSFQPPPTIHPRQHATKHSRQASVHFKRILLSKSAHRLRFGLAKPKDLQIETNLTQQGDTVFGDSRESLETICQIICIDKYGAQSRCYAKIDSGSQFDVISPEGCSQLGFKPTKYTGDDIQPFGKASKPIRPQGQIQIEWMPVNIEYIPQETYRITFLVIPMNDEDFIIGGRTAGKARLLQLGQTLDPKAKASF